jgi:hypothetical protein
MHLAKGHFLSIIVGDHLGMTLTFEKGEFRAPTVKLKCIALFFEGAALHTGLPQALGEHESP